MGKWVELPNEGYTCLFCVNPYGGYPAVLRLFFWTKPRRSQKYAIIGICPTCGDIRPLGWHRPRKEYTQEVIDAMV